MLRLRDPFHMGTCCTLIATKWKNISRALMEFAVSASPHGLIDVDKNIRLINKKMGRG